MFARDPLDGSGQAAPQGGFLRGSIPGRYGSLVNASTPFLRMAPHDSGPMWVATSPSYEFCIEYNLAGLTGAPGEST
jgi:hypothetical protein